MPGPGKHGKAKKAHSKVPKPNGVTCEENDRAFVTEIDNADTWNTAVDILCKTFNLPDLSRRSGLKKVHANFNAIYNRMDAFYQINLDNTKTQGAIVAIYAKMCVDAILRDRLFEKGVLDKIMPLCQLDETRHLALRALSTITHHAGGTIRMKIAMQANVLTKLLQDFPNDEKVAQLATITLSHSISAIADDAKLTANTAALKEIDMVAVFKSVLEAVRRPHSNPRVMMDHALELISSCSKHARAAMEAYPPSIGFLVAGLRSKDWATRSLCLGGLIRLHELESEDDPLQLHPQRMMAALERGLPAHLAKVLKDYGEDRTEMFLTLTCIQRFRTAMMESARDSDLRKLGITLANLITTTEFAIGDGSFGYKDPRTGKSVVVTTSLPFTRWIEAPPICARAIRALNNPKELDYADILDIKHEILRRDLPEVARMARRAIQRNPDQAYFYYALTLPGDGATYGLKAAKQGMKCRNTTPFIKYSLMHRAVEHAATMGVRVLQVLPRIGDKVWEEGISFLMSAFEDAKEYLDGAPPDNRHIKDVSYWLILLTMTISEDLSPDLHQLQPVFQKLKHAEEFSELFGVPIIKTHLRLCQQSAVKNYASGLRDFSRVFETYDNIRFSSEMPPTIDPEKAGNDLEAWLEDTDELDTDQIISCRGPTHVKGAKVNFDDISLYRCTWCGNPSAALRKCAACGETRYCDNACQKAHWSTHRKECKK